VTEHTLALPRPSALRELGAGVADLGRGFAVWGTSPRLMLLGAVPPLITGVIALALLVGLVLVVPVVAAALTGFADGWPPVLRDGLRLAIDLAIVALGGVVLVLAFTAATLTIGDPVYERIGRRVEDRLGDAPPEVHEPVLAGMLRALGEGTRLTALGVLVGLAAFLLGLIPVAGPALATATGILVGGRLLALELTGNAFAARGLRLADRRAAFRARPWRVIGFGAATAALFLIPFAPVVLMPAAVAGATILSRRILPD
jgi:CysZ protein